MTTNPSFIEAKKAEAREKFDKTFGYDNKTVTDLFEHVPRLHSFLDETLESFLSEIEGRVIPEKLIRQELGHNWNHRKGIETYYAQTEEEVAAFNDCREQTLEAFQHLRTGVTE